MSSNQEGTELSVTSPSKTANTIPKTATSEASSQHCNSALGLYGGYGTFVLSIAMIAFITAVISDVAGHLGCFIFLKDSVNALAFVALGTSIPGRGFGRINVASQCWSACTTGCSLSGLLSVRC